MFHFFVLIYIQIAHSLYEEIQTLEQFLSRIYLMYLDMLHTKCNIKWSTEINRLVYRDSVLFIVLNSVLRRIGNISAI